MVQDDVGDDAGTGRRRIRGCEFLHGETIRLTPVEAGLLTLMHAADILSVLTPTRERASTALGFAMYLVSSAADMLRAATRSPSGDAFAWNEYADRLDASISDEIVRRMVVDAPVDARGFETRRRRARRRGSAPRGSTSSSSCARDARSTDGSHVAHRARRSRSNERARARLIVT